MHTVHASTWKKGLVSSICAHVILFHFPGILYSSVYFLYISGVYYVMNIGWSPSCCATMVASIVSESEDTIHEAVSFSLSRLGLSGESQEEQLSAVEAV